MVSDDRSDAALVAAVREGDRDAYGVLFERWFDRVYDVARNIVRNPETAADVAQDTFIAAWERLDRLDNVDAFGGWLLRSARNRALDRLEREGRSRPQADDVVTGMHDRGAPDLVGSRRTLDPEEISARHDRDGLIGAAAVALGERDASILDLHLRHGLSAAEIASELGVTPNNAHQLLFRMRNKLGDAIGAYVLWHRGRPQCATLRAGIADTFDADTFSAVERHRRSCDECTERRSLLVAPEQLFSAAPLLVAPLLLRTAVRDALQFAGVPVSGTGGSGQVHLDDSYGGTDHVDTTGTHAGPPNPTANPAEPDSLADVDADVDADIDTADDAEADHDDRRNRRRLGLVLIAAAAIVAVAGAAVALGPSRSDSTPSAATPPAGTISTASLASTAPPTSTTLAPTQARAGTVPAVDDLATAPSEPPSAVPSTITPAQPPPIAPRTTPTTAPPAAPQTTERPAAPPTTAPPTTAPPTTGPPATAPPTTQPATTLPPAVSPTIVRLFFGAPPTGVLCPGTQTPRRIDWTSTDATTANLAVGASTRNVGVVGPFDACATSGDLVTLTVTGPGGTADRSIVTP